MDEKMKFIARLLHGDKMAELCHEFGISRKTGYKFWNGYKDIVLHGLTALTNCQIRDKLAGFTHEDRIGSIFALWTTLDLRNCMKPVIS